MSGNLIIFTAIIYAYISFEQFYKVNPGMGMAYAGYAFANLGLYLLAAK
jgi:hypothetical protein